MKAYVDAPRHLSRAMFRVSDALRRHAPSDVEIVERPADADLQVLHVIGQDALDFTSAAPRTAVIQYCLYSADVESWHPLWEKTSLVWSYYDLHGRLPQGANFYHAPLGVDPAFLTRPLVGTSRQYVMTSGYVAGSRAEAIEEVAHAADACGLATVHLGPMPVGLTKALPRSWYNVHEISDAALAALYDGARWVSGLRYIEGFELPVVEGLARGARPFVFDRQDMRQWYAGHAEFIPECEGNELVERLKRLFMHPQWPVSLGEIADVRHKFDWETIVGGFWSNILQTIHPAVGRR